MKPIYKLIADDMDITALLEDRLISMTITDEVGLVSDSISIELDDRDNAFAIPNRGATLEAFIVYDGKPMFPMGKFIVDEVELSGLPNKITITGNASNSDNKDEIASFKAPKSYSWKGYSLLGIVQTIARRYGLTESVDDTFRKVYVSHIDQTDESDSSFIQRVTKDYGAVIKINGGKLLFINPSRGTFPDGTPLPTIKIPFEDFNSFRMRISERGKYKKVIGKYHDYTAGKERKVEVGQGSPAFSLREIFTNSVQARMRANGKLREIQEGIYTFSGNMIGNPLISSESKIEIEDIPRAEIKGAWIVKNATHTISSNGFKTSIKATRPQKDIK